MDFKNLLGEETRKTMWKIVTSAVSDADIKKIKTELSKQGFVEPNPQYNDYGLRFDTGYLKRIGGSICMLPLAIMSEYVDVVCKSSMDREDGLMEEDILSDEMPDDELPNTNATALGNISYIALHTKNDQAKAKCLDFLWRYMNYYLDNYVRMAMESLGNNMIN